MSAKKIQKKKGVKMSTAVITASVKTLKGTDEIEDKRTRERKPNRQQSEHEEHFREQLQQQEEENGRHESHNHQSQETYYNIAPHSHGTSNQLTSPAPELASVSEVEESSYTKDLEEHKLKRREIHNEVERKRREHINTSIDTLATMVPQCIKNQAKNNNKTKKVNKGLILSRTAEFLRELDEKKKKRLESENFDLWQRYNRLKTQVDLAKLENVQLKEKQKFLQGLPPGRF